MIIYPHTDFTDYTERTRDACAYRPDGGKSAANCLCEILRDLRETKKYLARGNPMDYLKNHRFAKT